MKVFHEKDLTTETKDSYDEPESVEEEKTNKKSAEKRSKKKGSASSDGQAKSSDLKSKKEEELDDVSIVQEFYEEIALQKRINRLKLFVSILLIVVFLFLSGGYLIYLYSDVDYLLVGLKEHEHIYSEEGIRHDGDCRHYGYWSYICTIPFCKAEKQIWDSEPGNHKYNMSEYEVEIRDNGDVYHVYTCDVCGGLNYKLILNDEE